MTAFDRDAAEAELATVVARAVELREQLANDEWHRRRRAAFDVNRNPCSWCGSADAHPELDAAWSPTGRFICCGQGVVCRCRLARMVGQTPEEFAAVVCEQFTVRTA